MISRITGQLLEKSPPTVVIDCGGIAYEVDVPMSTFYQLPNVGESTTLYTHLAIREDAHLLYGFASADERAFFRKIIRISGIGARTALAILSGLTTNDVIQAVTLQDASRLIKIPGIGKKTAERLLLELKGQITGISTASLSGVVKNDTTSDILNALLALGYSEKEALKAMQQIPGDTTVSEGIRLSLKLLSKA